MKLIDNYWIEKYDSGIVHLLINTVDKWRTYHRYNDTLYRIYDEDGDAEYEDITLEEGELPFDSGTMYICTELQNKDQISFYYIPFNLIRK